MSDANARAFHVVCSLCKTLRNKLGAGIPERQKGNQTFLDYRWCKVCDRAA